MAFVEVADIDFVDSSSVGQFDRGSLIIDDERQLTVCSGVALWHAVNSSELSRCLAINESRLAKWKN
ncbi:MAG: hypothetical protein PHC51_12360 [bacterium]|nr:hypothetical protein [bacterium]